MLSPNDVLVSDVTVAELEDGYRLGYETWANLIVYKSVCTMLDQNFSFKNFMAIYAIENRKGRIPKETMSKDFQEVVEGIQGINKKLQVLRNKKKDERTDDDNAEIAELKKELKDLRKKKLESLQLYTEELSNKVNHSDFRFQLEIVTLDKKFGFKINSEEHPQLFAMKQLQYNLQKTFKVKQANRHSIMANIKLLLKTQRPYCIIRTDVFSFFESIPQDCLLRQIMGNTILSYKSKTFIKAILTQYEGKKQELISVEQTNIKKGLGVPRGIGISSLLSEIYMRDLDDCIKKRPEVIFYARYVDDIFILLSQLPQGKNISTIEDYYQNLENEFQKYGLTLNKLGGKKGFAVDYSKLKLNQPEEFTYLGYKIIITKTKENGTYEASYRLSDAKKERIKRRIDNAFNHFNGLNKNNLHQARKDLVDSLKLITGNVKLHKSKSGIKTGLYFNGDLLEEDLKDLHELNDYLYEKKVILYANLFKTNEEQSAYEAALKNRIRKFDFVKFWEEKKMYSLSGKRLQEIMKWLNYETKEN